MSSGRQSWDAIAGTYAALVGSVGQATLRTPTWTWL